MALQDTTKRGKESKRCFMPFSRTLPVQLAAETAELGKCLSAQEVVGRWEGGPESFLFSPTHSGVCPPATPQPAHGPEKILWAAAPSQSPPRAPQGLPSHPQGWQMPRGGAPGKMSPKEPGPLELAPPPAQAAQPRGKEGRRGLGAAWVSQGRGGWGVSGESIS